MIDEAEKMVLGLGMPTDSHWANLAEKSLEEILTDHAYCEQKAATTCISMIVQFADKHIIVETLTPIVREEWSHFESVLKEIKKRNFSFGLPRKDQYILEINKIVRKGGDRNTQLVEKLLLCALIEARSCERFRTLWKNIDDEKLSNFYYRLMVSEAGHYKTFIKLAKEFKDENYVINRWRQFLKEEASVIKKLKPLGNTIH